MCTETLNIFSEKKGCVYWNTKYFRWKKKDVDTDILYIYTEVAIDIDATHMYIGFTDSLIHWIHWFTEFTDSLNSLIHWMHWFPEVHESVNSVKSVNSVNQWMSMLKH